MLRCARDTWLKLASIPLTLRPLLCVSSGRSYRIPSRFGCGMVDRELIREHHPVMLARRPRGDEFLLHVRAHRHGVALVTIAPAAASRPRCSCRWATPHGLAPPAPPAFPHDPPVAPRHRVVPPARDAKFALARFAHEIHAVFARLPAPQAPRRALVPAHQLEIPFPLD